MHGEQTIKNNLGVLDAIFRKVLSQQQEQIPLYKTPGPSDSKKKKHQEWSAGTHAYNSRYFTLEVEIQSITVQGQPWHKVTTLVLEHWSSKGNVLGSIPSTINKPMERCSIPLVIRKMQMKTIMRALYQLIYKSKIQRG